MISTTYESFKAGKAAKAARFLNVIFALCAVAFFCDSAARYASLPVVEKNPHGTCVRVADANGVAIPGGCNAVRKKKITLYNSEYVAR